MFKYLLLLAMLTFLVASEDFHNATELDAACKNITNEVGCKAATSCNWCSVAPDAIDSKSYCISNVTGCESKEDEDHSPHCPVACFIAPCMNYVCASNTSLKCFDDYCSGGCDRVWKDESGHNVTCEKEERRTAESCDGKCENLPVPKFGCASGSPKFICASTELSPFKSENESSVSDDSSCAWVGQCPSVSDTCSEKDCDGQLSIMMVTKCSDDPEVYSETKCVPVGNQCQKAQVCPYVEPPVFCIQGGPCGDQCYAKDDAIKPEAFSLPVCAKLMEDDCVQKCKLQFKTYCTYTNGGCTIDYDPGYLECKKKCESDDEVEQPPCHGFDPCACDYSQCFYAQRELVTETSKYIRSECILNTESASVKADPTAKIISPKPIWCNAVDSSNNTGNFTKRIDPINIFLAQKRIDEDKVPFSFILTILSVLEPTLKANGDQVHTFVVTLSGNGSDAIAASVKEALCNKLRKAVNASGNANCTVEKVIEPTTKRGLLQTSGTSTRYVASTTVSSSTTPATPPTNNDNLGNNGVFYQPSWAVFAILCLVIALANM